MNTTVYAPAQARPRRLPFKDKAKICRPALERLVLKVQNLDTDFAFALSSRMLACGRRHLVLSRPSVGHVHEEIKLPMRCGVPQCPYCGEVKHRRDYHKVLDLLDLDSLGDGPVYHVILTLPHRHGAEPKAELERLHRSLDRFKNSLARKAGPNGKKARGAGFIHPSKRNHTWHVHFHFLVVDLPMPVARLKALWRRHGEGGFVDVIRVRGGDPLPDCYLNDDAPWRFDNSLAGNVKRVAWYISRPAMVCWDSTDAELDVLAQTIRATHGKKLFRKFGKPPAKPEYEAPVVTASSESGASVGSNKGAPSWRFCGTEWITPAAPPAWMKNAAVLAEISRRALRVDRPTAASMQVLHRQFSELFHHGQDPPTTD